VWFGLVTNGASVAWSGGTSDGLFSTSLAGADAGATELSPARGSPLATDGESVYFGVSDSVGTTSLESVPLGGSADGGAPKVLASGLTGHIGGIAVDATSVYFTLSGALLKVAK
jgi:hypothetical protein